MPAETIDLDPRTFATDAAKWSAVLDRVAVADGAFVYAVTTTGIYCRPTCPSRRPRRENARFLADAAAAERAGFRPCRRCRPDEASPERRRAALIADLCRRIEAAEEAPSLDALAAEAGLSRFHLHRLFKATVGLTPKAYADSLRAERARHELTQSSTVTEAIYGAGFNSSGRFYAASNRMLGMTPSDFRAGGDGATIRFAVGQCTLGPILAAASGKGVCAILLGDDPDALVRELQDLFPSADLIGADPAFEGWMARIIGFVDDPRLGLDLPLDLRGTTFQRRVWRALTQVPPGTTASYAEIAARIGMPKAARAVAGACAANRLAVAIPCHRVVRRDGAVSGYRWGVERKTRLLQREASA